MFNQEELMIRQHQRGNTLVLLLTAASMLYGQSQPPVPGTLPGRLVTGKANTPVANAVVQWSIAGVPPGASNTAITDANGNFAFEIPLSAATQIQLATTANLYNPAQTSVQVQPGMNPQVTIPLVHKAAGQFGAVSGSVRSTSGQTIPNATVSILGAGDLLTTTTDSNVH